MVGPRNPLSRLPRLIHVRGRSAAVIAQQWINQIGVYSQVVADAGRSKDPRWFREQAGMVSYYSPMRLVTALAVPLTYHLLRQPPSVEGYSGEGAI